MKEYEIEKEACRVLCDCLTAVEAIVRVRRQPTSRHTRADCVLEIETAERKTMSLVVEVKSGGQPRTARDAINQLYRYRDACPDAYLVFMAPYIAPAAAEICRAEGVGYADLAGNCHLSFGTIYIHTEGKPNPFPDRRRLRSLYSRKASRVLRVLLCTFPRAWTLSALAGEADVSIGHAHKVKAALAEREWISSTPDGLTLRQPQALLAEWAENYQYERQERRELYSALSVKDIEAQLSAFCRRQDMTWALTGFSAAERLAPFTRYQRVHAYVDADVQALVDALSFKDVSGGANVSLLKPYDRGVFYESVEAGGAPVVSPVQLYIDLRGIGGRGDDAAEFLLQEVIAPRW